MEQPWGVLKIPQTHLRATGYGPIFPGVSLLLIHCLLLVQTLSQMTQVSADRMSIHLAQLTSCQMTVHFLQKHLFPF